MNQPKKAPPSREEFLATAKLDQPNVCEIDMSWAYHFLSPYLASKTCVDLPSVEEFSEKLWSMPEAENEEENRAALQAVIDWFGSRIKAVSVESVRAEQAVESEWMKTALEFNEQLNSERSLCDNLAEALKSYEQIPLMRGLEIERWPAREALAEYEAARGAKIEAWERSE